MKKPAGRAAAIAATASLRSEKVTAPKAALDVIPGAPVKEPHGGATAVQLCAAATEPPAADAAPTAPSDVGATLSGDAATVSGNGVAAAKPCGVAEPSFPNGRLDGQVAVTARSMVEGKPHRPAAPKPCPHAPVALPTAPKPGSTSQRGTSLLPTGATSPVSLDALALAAVFDDRATVSPPPLPESLPQASQASTPPPPQHEESTTPPPPPATVPPPLPVIPADFKFPRPPGRPPPLHEKNRKKRRATMAIIESVPSARSVTRCATVLSPAAQRARLIPGLDLARASTTAGVLFKGGLRRASAPVVVQLCVVVGAFALAPSYVDLTRGCMYRVAFRSDAERLRARQTRHHKPEPPTAPHPSALRACWPKPPRNPPPAVAQQLACLPQPPPVPPPPASPPPPMSPPPLLEPSTPAATNAQAAGSAVRDGGVGACSKTDRDGAAAGGLPRTSGPRRRDHSAPPPPPPSGPMPANVRRRRRPRGKAQTARPRPPPPPAHTRPTNQPRTAAADIDADKIAVLRRRLSLARARTVAQQQALVEARALARAREQAAVLTSRFVHLVGDYARVC